MTEREMAVLSERVSNLSALVNAKVSKVEFSSELRGIHDDIREIKEVQKQQHQDRAQLTRLVVGTLASTLLTLIISIVFLVLERA